jgi:hypothetical protein
VRSAKNLRPGVGKVMAGRFDHEPERNAGMLLPQTTTDARAIADPSLRQVPAP